MPELMARHATSVPVDVPPAGPLQGVRVFDASSVIMGPYATQILADFGAEVICVEERTGDTNRHMGPPQVAPGLSAGVLNLLRNKRNVCLDLKHPAGREAFLRIAATCDVVVTNLRPGPLARLGLDDAAIRAVRPDVIFCRAQGWPSDSEYADRPAYDDVIQAACGICAAAEIQTGRPAMAPTLVADKVSGLTIANAVLAALFHRARTGEGQSIEVPMIDALVAFTLVEHGNHAIPVPPIGPGGYGRVLAPERHPYATLDGWLAVLPYSASNYRDLFRAGGRDDLLDDPRIATKASRNEHSGALYAEVRPIIATRTTAFWVEYCEAHDIPAGAVRSIDEIVAELPVITHPIAGEYHHIPPPVRWSGFPEQPPRPAPRPGEHSREILAGVGYTAEEISALHEAGAVPILDPV